MPAIPWPSPTQLAKMGLVPCQADSPCGTWVDPANVPSRLCSRHQRQQRTAASHRHRPASVKP